MSGMDTIIFMQHIAKRSLWKILTHRIIMHIISDVTEAAKVNISSACPAV